MPGQPFSSTKGFFGFGAKKNSPINTPPETLTADELVIINIIIKRGNLIEAIEIPNDKLSIKNKLLVIQTLIDKQQDKKRYVNAIRPYTPNDIHEYKPPTYYTTALTTAAAEGHSEIVKLLLDYGAELKAVRTSPGAKSGATSLTLAAHNCDVETLEVILSHPSFMEYKAALDEDGEITAANKKESTRSERTLALALITTLIPPILPRHWDAIKLLIRYGAFIPYTELKTSGLYDISFIEKNLAPTITSLRSLLPAKQLTQLLTQNTILEDVIKYIFRSAIKNAISQTPYPDDIDLIKAMFKSPEWSKHLNAILKNLTSSYNHKAESQPDLPAIELLLQCYPGNYIAEFAALSDELKDNLMTYAVDNRNDEMILKLICSNVHPSSGQRNQIKTWQEGKGIIRGPLEERVDILYQIMAADEVKVKGQLIADINKFLATSYTVTQFSELPPHALQRAMRNNGYIDTPSSDAVKKLLTDCLRLDPAITDVPLSFYNSRATRPDLRTQLHSYIEDTENEIFNRRLTFLVVGSLTGFGLTFTDYRNLLS
jgi:hypothetical protein